ncbi:hypothetical protein DRH14_04085, partial [Candidatus Shapirobacteria bacterium]
QADFDDLRFTNEEENQSLDYWIESKSDGEWAYVWVEIDSIDTNNGTQAYMYYGNPSANSMSNYDNTFTKDYGESGFFGLWHMDEGSGTSTADSSGNGRTATLENSPNWVGSDGGEWDNISQQFSTGDCINLTHSTEDHLSIPHYSFTNNWTVMGWFWLDGYDGYGYSAIFTHGQLDHDNRVYVGTSSHRLGVYSQVNNGDCYNATAEEITLNEWHHFAVTVSSTEGVKVYLNGELYCINSSATGGWDNPTHDVEIGANTHSSWNRGMDGKVDEFRHYNRVLSEEEIKAYYRRHKYASPEPVYSVGDEEQSPYHIFDCSIINTSGTHYLAQDILNSGTSPCMNISANNIILDCQGYMIDGDNLADYGIYIYRDSEQTTNITVKNCVVADWGLANIYLYNADGNNLTGVTANSSPNYGFYLYHSDSNNFSDCTANSNYDGFYLHYSDSNLISDSKANSNDRYGFFLYHSSSNTISNLTVSSNTNYGIRIYADSDNNIIANSTISNNTYAGLYLDEDGSNDPEYNEIYNCLLNNSGTYGNIRVDSGITGENYFNTTEQSGTRIYSSGTRIGGNYWTNPSGTGYSDTCNDTDHDGFCDDPLNLSYGTSVAWDHLPLSDEYYQYCVCNCMDLNETGAVYYLARDILDSDASVCINISADDITLDCQTYSIDGTDSASSYGIKIHRTSSTSVNVTVRNCKISDWTYSVSLEYADDTTILNSEMSSNSKGLYVFNTDSLNVSNCTFSSNSDGIEINTCTSCEFSDSTFKSNGNALTIAHLSGTGSTFTGLNISGCTNNAIYFPVATAGQKFYNNFINCSSHLGYASSTGINSFNTTKQAGTRITDSDYFNEIGGNYWANPSGTGYSEICVDNDHDGFCDQTYELDENNIDYLPYAAYDPCNTTLYMWNGTDWEGTDSTYLAFWCRAYQTNCAAENQNSTTPIFNITMMSTGCQSNVIVAWINESLDQKTLFCANNSDPSTGLTVSTTKTVLYTNATYNESVGIWAWMNYANPQEVQYFDFYLKVEEVE